jgi:hypothetical protein
MTPGSRARRLLTATLLGTAALSCLTGLATPAQAQPGQLRDVPDRVVRIEGDLLEPRASAVGSPLRFAPRIGRANDTPDSQTWTERPGRRRGAVALVHTPSIAGGGVQLCADVEGDSREAGARLVLRPCDGTDSQLWLRPTTVPPSAVVNVQSGLRMTRVNGAATQEDVVRRDPSVPQNEIPREVRERGRNQLFFISPKSFGVGGA